MIASYQYLRTWITSRMNDERGASLVEYALLLALIAMVCLAAVTALGQTTSQQYSEIGSAID